MTSSVRKCFTRVNLVSVNISGSLKYYSQIHKVLNDSTAVLLKNTMK